MIGDGKTPDLFFVSSFEGGRKSRGVILITRSFELAYTVWSNMPRTHESSLEGRRFGTICSVEPKDDDDKRLVRIDDSATFRRMYSKK